MDQLYNVLVTPYALNQLTETANYISCTLSSRITAQKWLDMMEQEMHSLSFMPNRIPLTPEEPWHSEGLHRMRVKNYYIYFWIDENSKGVWITAIIYSGRNQERQLEGIPDN